MFVKSPPIPVLGPPTVVKQPAKSAAHHRAACGPSAANTNQRSLARAASAALAVGEAAVVGLRTAAAVQRPGAEAEAVGDGRQSRRPRSAGAHGSLRGALVVDGDRLHDVGAALPAGRPEPGASGRG